jgi:hypothetical protein
MIAVQAKDVRADDANVLLLHVPRAVTGSAGAIRVRNIRWNAGALVGRMAGVHWRRCGRRR